MNVRSVLVLLFVLRTVTPQQQQNALCAAGSQPPECAEPRVRATNYALRVYNAQQVGEEMHTVVTVRMTDCPYRGVPSPRWYKLASVSGAVGRFEQPLRTMEASLCSDEAEIVFESCYPSQLDLPRNYTWITAAEGSLDPQCFKLTIVSEVEGAACEEVDVCADSMSGDGDVLGSSSSPPAEQQHGSADQPLTTSQPTLTTTAAAVEPTTLAAIEQCQKKNNCTGAKMRVFCGTDGKIYNSRCEMRYEECIRNVERNSIRIAHVGYCAPTSPPPTEAMTKCQAAAQRTHVPWRPQCDCQGLYKVIQCWQNGNVVECWCSNPNSGSEIGGTRRRLECTDPETFNGLSSCLYLIT